MPADGDVFISYPRDRGAGQRWAAAIEAWLRARAVECFRDDTDLGFEGSLSRQIEDRVHGCRLLLCIVSERTRDSTWVDRELSLADQRRPQPPGVVHVLVEPAARRPAIGAESLLVDFTADAAAGWRDLARAVGLLAEALPAERRGLEVAYLHDSLRPGSGVAALPNAARAGLRARWMPRLDPAREPAPPARHAVALALGRLELDDRPGVGLDGDGLPDIAWVEVPAGVFIFQDGDRRELPAYWMARFPVTNAQYGAFIKAGGYDEARWWEGLYERIQRPTIPGWNDPNRPRESVSWYEAVAFCRLLSSRRGFHVRLPVEQEWEKAARGTAGNPYPWGNDFKSGHANVNEAEHVDNAESREGHWYLRAATAVGLYPQGASQFGIQDLSGNVWEWCLNQHADLQACVETVSFGGKAARALRGGSWSEPSGRARATSRFGLGPDLGYVSRGFRVLCASPVRS